MIGKTLALVTMAAIGTAAAAGWPDLKRFVKIKQISARAPRPDLVPAQGRTSYPSAPALSVPDGTGDFDSARRGGHAIRA
jgi:hypothetical protein